MSKPSFVTGFGAHRNIHRALKQMRDEVNSSMIKPDGVILVIGAYSISKKDLNKELKLIKQDFGSCPMIGTQQQAVFTSDGLKVNYAIKGVGCLVWEGMDLITKRIKNIRRNSIKKGQKFKAERSRNFNSEYHLLFPPGIYYPPLILKPLQNLSKFNPLFIYNSRIALHNKIINPISKLITKMQDLLNMGIPYSSIWDFIDGFRNESSVQNFAGAFGINTDSFKRTFQFINWKSSGHDLIIGSIKKENLKIGTGFGVGIKTNSTKKLEIKKNLSGGLITDFGDFNEKKTAEIRANKTLLNQLEIDQEVWYRNTESTLGFSVFHPYYIEPTSKSDDTSNIEDHSNLDHYPSLYFLMANKNMNSTMVAAPDQVIDEIQKKNYKAYLGIQSANDITSSIGQAVKSAKINANIKEIYSGIFIECSNRAQALEEQFTNLLQENINHVPKPFLGLVTSGEIAPRRFPIVCSSLVTILLGK
jgi:hypothetical protein